MAALIRSMAQYAAAFGICAVSFSNALSVEPPEYWPTGGWRNSTPEAQGVDAAQLAAAMDFLREERLPIHSLFIARHGYAVLDASFYPFTPDSLHDVASVTKSVTSTLIGIAIDKGFIKDVQQPVLGLFPGRTAANREPQKDAISLEHLLTMTSGLECVNSPTEVTLFNMMASPDWVQFMLDLPMAYDPGAQFDYSSGGVHLLSGVIRETTGEGAMAFARQHLFAPLGIQDAIWPLDPKGEDNHGWGDLKLRPRDMAKLGFLFLHEGRWNDRQVVSADWVRAATEKHVPTNSIPHGHYGYLWWIRDSGAFSALGRGGQRIYVLPEQDLVVVVTAGAGGPAEGKLDEFLTTYILPAVRSTTPLPENPGAVARLEAQVRQAAVGSAAPKRVPRLPKLAKQISGLRFAFDANPFGISGFRLCFNKKSAEAAFELAEGRAPSPHRTIRYAVGLDDVYRTSPGREGFPAAAKGYWKNDREFVIDLDEIGNINHWHITLTFEGDRLTATLRERTGLGQTKLMGRSQT